MPETPSPKNIVICCDGTGNHFNYNNSNVVKLYTACKIDNAQAGYYNPGVGTMGAPNETSKLGKMWSRIKGLAFGAGFKDHVLDAYRYLMNEYKDNGDSLNNGDHIYIFGFSRGAYAARALAAMIHAYGLLCEGNESHIPYIWTMFTQKLDEMHDQPNRTLPVAKEFKATFSRDVKIHFVGVWDTVSAVGWIREPLRLLYLAQNPAIETGRHAVSIDERRCFYVDNLWGDALLDQNPKQDILQVWFAGVHSDVGGSYAQAESYLPNIALEWMLEEAEKVGLLLEPDRARMVLGQPTEKPQVCTDLYKAPDPTYPIHKSLKGAWWLLEFLPHRYYDKDDAKEKWRIPWGASRQIPADTVVHPSVVSRMDDPSYTYQPRNLARTALSDHSGTQPGTQANLKGYFVYEAGQSKPKDQAASAGSGATKSIAAAAALFAAIFLLRKFF